MKRASVFAYFLAAALWLGAGHTSLAAAQATAQRRVEGTVRDQQGLAVAGARVTIALQQGTLRRFAVSTAERFRIDGLTPGAYELRVEAAGFAPRSLAVDLRTESVTALEVRLDPAGIAEQVVVTATRSERRMGDVPASISVLTSEDIRQSPAVVADDVLRQIPTFSLFRRTSSLSSHPTAQGVSLRGIGPSGVSRTLVLLDSVPFNDPFGGWVYWTRVPLEGLERIEVVDGSSSSLYGNYGMGGVINIVSSRPRRRTFEFKPQYGSRNSPKVDFFGSDVWGKLGVTVDASLFNTDGFPIVTPSEKGIIDTNATVDFRNVNVKLDYDATDRVKAFFRFGYFSENRSNAKILEVNDTRWKSASGGVQVRLPDASDLQASLFTDVEDFHSTFLAVAAAAGVARSVVRLTIDQRVPTTALGGMVHWAKAFGSKNYFSAGTDWRSVDGDSQEDAYNAVTGPVTPPIQNAVLALRRVSGGSQRSIGAFVQHILTPVPKATITLSARVDRWRNYDAHNLETAVIPGTVTNNRPTLPDKEDTALSPRLAARYQVTDRVSLWGDIGTGFRAPTLNELYRQFRVGTVLTVANDQLGPERLVGGEVGINVAPTRDVTWRLTWFDNRIKDPVSNVTLSQVGANVTQQRQNLGRTRVRGVQTDVEYRITSSLRVSGGYLYDQATITENPRNASLVGKFLPQVPKHRGSVHVAYANPKYLNVTVGVQSIGRQFDDDLNSRVVPAAARAENGYTASTDPGLPGYALVDFMVSRSIGRNLEVFVGAQNLFNQVYFVGTLPTTIGSPRLVNGGVRVRFAGR